MGTTCLSDTKTKPAVERALFSEQHACYYLDVSRSFFIEIDLPYIRLTDHPNSRRRWEKVMLDAWIVSRRLHISLDAAVLILREGRVPLGVERFLRDPA